LYELLGRSVAPLFYQRDASGLPGGWLEMIRHTLRSLGPRVQAERMVREYVTSLYAPATRASLALTGVAPAGAPVAGPAVAGAPVAGSVSTAATPATTAAEDSAAGAADFAAARQLAAWKHRVMKAWPGVRIEHVEADAGEPSVGATLSIHASVALGELTRDDVCVEVVYGRPGEDDEISESCYVVLSPDEPPAGAVPGDSTGAGAGSQGAALARYSGEVELGRPGAFGYTVRVLPSHPLLASRAELGLVTLPDAPAGMTNGDLR
jgi:starch phosphorylase